MQLFGLFKRKKLKPSCDHEWYYAASDYIYEDNGCDVDAIDACWIFCIKCKDDRLVYKKEWDRIRRKQEIIRSMKISSK